MNNPATTYLFISKFRGNAGLQVTCTKDTSFGRVSTTPLECLDIQHVQTVDNPIGNVTVSAMQGH